MAAREPRTLRHHSRPPPTPSPSSSACAPATRRGTFCATCRERPSGRQPPYFMHFVLEAVEACGTLSGNTWAVESCASGLPRGDLRQRAPGGLFRPAGRLPLRLLHAWGGTPAYQLPARMLGFRMLQPGFRENRPRPPAFRSRVGRTFAHAHPIRHAAAARGCKRAPSPYLEIPAGLHVRLLRDNVPD